MFIEQKNDLGNRKLNLSRLYGKGNIDYENNTKMSEKKSNTFIFIITNSV